MGFLRDRLPDPRLLVMSVAAILVASAVLGGVRSSERTAVAEGAHRLFAVLAAAAVALAVHGITVLWGRIRAA